MTSFAFILGVLPLAISTGAGSGSQNAIGVGVMGGMISATVLAIFFVPAFFVFVLKALRTKRPSEEVDVKAVLARVTQGEADDPEGAGEAAWRSGLAPRS